MTGTNVFKLSIDQGVKLVEREPNVALGMAMCGPRDESKISRQFNWLMKES